MRLPLLTTRLILALVAVTSPALGGTGVVQYIPSSGVYQDAFGFGLYSFQSDPVGLYVNFASTLRENEPHYDSLTVDSFGDPVTDRFKELTVFAVGPTRELTDSIAVYVGLGYGWGDAKAEKDDPTHILADDGRYYVDDPNNNESGININGGVALNVSARMSIDIGYHSFPGTGYLGIGWRF